MKLALFGATGLTGPSVLKEALARGHHVSALARNPDAITTSHERLRVVRGNALTEADVGECIAGSEVVLHCLGVGGRGDGKPNSLVSDSVALMLPLMKQRGVRRMVVMSNLWAGGSGAWGIRKIAIPVFARWLLPILADKDRMEAILHASEGVEWIAPRFPEIVEGPAKPLKTSPDGRGVSRKITTGSIAAFMLDHLTGDAFARETPAVSN
ncbi:MAG TPA: NAD(P)H-binding protein [Kofleriaceae bacterium]